MRRRITYLASVNNEHANLKTPVASLPTELLRIIFQYDADKHRLKRSKIVICHSWMRLGMVCSWWRRVLFNMPRVWANDLSSLGFKKGLLLLPLAKGASLNVVLRGKDKIFEDHGSISSVTPGLSCVIRSARRIRYTPSVEEDASRFSDLLCSKPLPTLESLTMDCSDYADTMLSDAVMAKHPKLRYLNFTDVFARPSAPDQLRVLNIDVNSWISEQKPTMELLLDLLSQCPVLRELSLQGVLDSRDVSLPTQWKRLRLPYATSLRLVHEELLSTIFLDHLSVPRMKKLHFGDETETEDALDSILRSWTLFSQREGCAPLSSGRSAGLTVEFDEEMGSVSPEHRLDLDESIRRLTKESGIQYWMNEQPLNESNTFIFKRPV